MKSSWVNKTHVEGYIFNKGDGRRALQKRVAGENAKNPGQEYIQGELNIATDESATNVITVYFSYVTPTWPAKNGKPERPNTTYQALETIINSGTTYEEVGTAATKVRIDGNIGVNDFYTRDGELASPKRIEGSFIHLMNGGEKIADRAATFEADMVIAGVTEQELEDEPNYLRLRGYVFNFRNDVLPVEFSVRSEGGIKYFESQDISNSNPMVTKVWGDILSTIIQIEHEVESAFGDPTVNVTTRTIRSWDVIGASAEPMEWDDDSTITKAELKQKLSEREERLADQKKRDEEYRNSQSGKSGFPTSTASSQVEEDDDDDFPF